MRIIHGLLNKEEGRGGGGVEVGNGPLTLDLLVPIKTWFLSPSLPISYPESSGSLPSGYPVPQERLWGTGILLPQDFWGKTMEAVTELIQSSQSKNLNFSNSPESLLAPAREIASLPLTMLMNKDKSIYKIMCVTSRSVNAQY